MLSTPWRGGDAAALQRLSRGAMLEAICRLREQLERVVFLYTPSHRGIAHNAYADAAAKSHLQAARSVSDVRGSVLARPSLFKIESDFNADGTLREQGPNAAPGEWILWDRGLFTA